MATFSFWRLNIIKGLLALDVVGSNNANTYDQGESNCRLVSPRGINSRSMDKGTQVDAKLKSCSGHGRLFWPSTAQRACLFFLGFLLSVQEQQASHEMAGREQKVWEELRWAADAETTDRHTCGNKIAAF